MKMQIHESLGPLLRGIGLTIILIGTIAGAVQARKHAGAWQTLHQTAASEGGHKTSAAAAAPRENSLETLTQEIEELRETVQEDTMVEDVLTNPWFDVLGIAGSSIAAASFYAEWYCKRPKAVG
jgi:hypothetical protein